MKPIRFLLLSMLVLSFDAGSTSTSAQGPNPSQGAPTPGQSLQQGQQLLAQGKYADAIPHLERASAADQEPTVASNGKLLLAQAYAGCLQALQSAKQQASAQLQITKEQQSQAERTLANDQRALRNFRAMNFSSVGSRGRSGDPQAQGTSNSLELKVMTDMTQLNKLKGESVRLAQQIATLEQQIAFAQQRMPPARTAPAHAQRTPRVVPRQPEPEPATPVPATPSAPPTTAPCQIHPMPPEQASVPHSPPAQTTALPSPFTPSAPTTEFPRRTPPVRRDAESSLPDLEEKAAAPITSPASPASEAGTFWTGSTLTWVVGGSALCLLLIIIGLSCRSSFEVVQATYNSVDVTAIVQSKIQQRSLTVTAIPEAFGLSADPDALMRGKLTLTFKVGSERKTASIESGWTITLPSMELKQPGPEASQPRPAAPPRSAAAKPRIRLRLPGYSENTNDDRTPSARPPLH